MLQDDLTKENQRLKLFVNKERKHFCWLRHIICSTATGKVFISVFNQLDAQNLFNNKFYFMPLHVSSTCARHPYLLTHSTVHSPS